MFELASAPFEDLRERRKRVVKARPEARRDAGNAQKVVRWNTNSDKVSIKRKVYNINILIALCDNIIPHERRAGDKMLTRYFVKPFQGFVTMSQSVSTELKVFTTKPVVTISHPVNDDPGERISKEKARKYLALDPSGKYSWNAFADTLVDFCKDVIPSKKC